MWHAARQSPRQAVPVLPLDLESMRISLPLSLLICLVVFVLTSSASNEVDTLDAVERASSKTDAFLAWLGENGAKMDYLDFVRMKGRGITAVASSDLGVRYAQSRRTFSCPFLTCAPSFYLILVLFREDTVWHLYQRS